MFRRVVMKAAAPAALCRQLSVSADLRDTLTKPLSSLKEECKGQNLDLADMADAMKGAAYKFQEASKQAAIEDKLFKGKATTLSASLKAYNTRLANLQNETRSMQAEVDALLKLLWGTERPDGANFATPPPPESPRTVPNDFEVEPPPLAKALGEEAPTPDPVASPARPSKPAEPAVEKVEGEPVPGDAGGPAADSTSVPEEEIEVETIEVDVEPPAQTDPVETMKVTDITKELYERGVNFSDCMDAHSLRQRYRDVLSGKIPPSANASTASSSSAKYTEPLTANPSQPHMPQRAAQPPQQRQQQQYQYQQPPPNNNPGNGLAYDPYPNAQRKMVDPMKYVREIKQELAVEKGIDANTVDLWSGKVRLDDNKRLYDYPSIQSYPIEVRQKGDVPS